MFEHYATLRSIFEGVSPVLRKYIGDGKVQAFDNAIEQRTANNRPVIMLYGVYNAGKSTLLNALAGAELAPVDDIPLTDTVTPYTIGDVVIIDTPGIDAPIEHEKVARTQLESSDAVIFVLNSDGVFEEQAIYDEIRSILNAGKPMVLVINNKNNYTPGSPEYVASLAKLRTNLYRALCDDEVLTNRLDHVPSYLVNAKAALKGKLENKPALVQHSQLAELEKSVRRLFHATNSAQIAHTLAVQLQSLVLEGLTVVQQNLTGKELLEVQKMSDALRDGKAELLQKTMTHAHKARHRFKNDIEQKILVNDPDVQLIVDRWGTEQQTYFADQLDRLLTRLGVQAEKLDAFMADLNPVNSTATSTQHTRSQGGDKSPSAVRDLLNQSVKRGFSLKPDETMVSKGIVITLKQGKEWFPQLFKGIGPKTMEKMAGKVTPFIGPAIDAARAGWDYYEAKKQEQQQIAQQRQWHEQARHLAEGIVTDCYENLSELLDDALNDALDPIAAELQSQTILLDQSSEAASNDRDRLKIGELQLQKL